MTLTERERDQLDAMRPNPNPRIVALLDLALTEIAPKLNPHEYADWLSWAAQWRSGQRVPQACVDVAHRCFEHEDDPIFHCLGQLAWGAKEACYSAPTSGWLVVRYVADAMIYFGIAFRTETIMMLEPPTIDALRQH